MNAKEPSRAKLSLNADVMSQGLGVDPYGAKKSAILGEFERHEGWHQNVRKEKNHMIE